MTGVNGPRTSGCPDNRRTPRAVKQGQPGAPPPRTPAGGPDGRRRRVADLRAADPAGGKAGHRVTGHLPEEQAGQRGEPDEGDEDEESLDEPLAQQASYGGHR
ncbi:hypothetical protein GCM10010259_69010 [Streptomyces daghestanicus]|uniref:Uncharacterized protein n=1 Tax=Streptomyces daghestanicus TaxID=66885 RepID=A0ABQ3PWT4_9ACTN|nr:hypothetical protein GCM10010259_69010 [Streptomyces daghestanicus]GHI29467.1 hypothetical protein Sdagh_11970 [Streptomyces daghestanicus]